MYEPYKIIYKLHIKYLFAGFNIFALYTLTNYKGYSEALPIYGATQAVAR
jgi:hypothetical protein